MLVASAIAASGASDAAHEISRTNVPAVVAQAPSGNAVSGVEVASLHDAARRRTMRPDELASPVQVVIYKSKRTLALYRAGVFDREFRIVLGLQPEGRKRHEHDARTPEGLYRIVGIRRHERWQHFLELDYPNADDRRSYAGGIRAGTIPDDDGAPFAIGGEIGIHGNDRAEEQAAGRDWTKGCIAMSAVDIEQVAAEVPVGTPVWIVK